MSETSSVHNGHIIVASIYSSGSAFSAFLHEELFTRLSEFDKNFELKQIQEIIHLVYHECILQVFDCMTWDFQDFSLKLVSYPNFDRFYYHSILFNNQPDAINFQNKFKTFAIGLFFEIREQYPMIFVPGKVFVLEHSALDHIVFKLFQEEVCS